MLTQTQTAYQRPVLVTDWSKTGTPSNLISTLDNGELVISSIDLAIGLGVKHKSLIETIRTYLASVQRFGRVPFETAPFETKGGVQQMTVTKLNENQALFIGSLSRNTVQVVAFKETLVDEFDKARKAVSDLFRKQELRHDLVPVVNALTEKMIGLEGKIDRLNKARKQYYEAKVVEKRQETQKKQNEEKQKERTDLFALFERYIKVHDFQSSDVVMDKVIATVKEYYKLDLTIQRRDPGEHYFDVAIRLGMGHCVAEVIKCHMYYSGKVR